MIHAHVLDSWTLPSERSRAVFPYLNILGGMAAPLFLWLAGLALVLAAEHSLARTGNRTEAAARVLRRGAEVFALAFLFRLQAFIVSPGNPVLSLLRVDILNIMGPAMMAAALAWRVATSPRGVLLVMAAAATGLALVTPIVRAAAWVEVLPPPVQWYVTPAGNHSTFVLFPWAAFVFAGAACGAALTLAGAGNDRLALRRIGWGGAVLILGGLYASTLPTIYAQSSFWTTSPTYFAIRTGVLMVTLSVLQAATPLAAGFPRSSAALERFGRSSLFVYWIHVELVYGYATLLIHRRLPLWGTAVAFVLFSAVMYLAVVGRDRLAAWWQARTPRRPTPEVVRA